VCVNSKLLSISFKIKNKFGKKLNTKRSDHFTVHMFKKKNNRKEENRPVYLRIQHLFMDFIMMVNYYIRIKKWSIWVNVIYLFIKYNQAKFSKF